MADKDNKKRLGGLRFAVFYAGQLEKTVTLAQDCIFLGRLLTSHLPVEDPKVSRMHAVIEIRDGTEVLLNDLESSNGTHLNGKQVTNATLKNGDVIEIGDSRINVVFLSPEEVAAIPAVVYHSGISRGLSQQVGVDTVMLDIKSPKQEVDVSLDDIDKIITQLEPAVNRVTTPLGKIGEKRQTSSGNAGEGTVIMRKGDKPAKGAEKGAKVKETAVSAATTQAGKRPTTTSIDKVTQEKALRMIHGTGTALEVKVQWGEEILDVLHLDQPTTISVGKNKTNTYIIPPMEAYPPTLPLLSPVGEKTEKGAPPSFMLGFTDNMEGWIYTGEKLHSLQELKKSPRLRASKRGAHTIHLFPLTSSDKGMISIENLAFSIQTVRSFPPYKSPVNKVDRRPFFIGAMLYTFLSLFAYFFPVSESEPTVAEQVETTAAAYEVIYSRDRAKSILDSMASKELRDLGSPKGEAHGKATVGRNQRGNYHDTKVGGEEGARSKAVPRVPGQSGGSGETGGENLAKALEALKSDDITRLLAKSGISGLGGGVGMTNAPTGITGAPRIFGSVGSNLKGEKGAGVGGVGGGGGGDSVDIGGLGTKGRGSGGGGYGTVKLGQKMEALIGGGDDEDVSIRGALDRDLIKKVIERNKGQIQFCYDTKLQLAKLRGKPSGRVMVYWKIAPSGRVTETSVRSSTMNDASFEQCLMDRIRTWIFPEPKGGGSVKVEYPFVFRPAG